MEVQRPDATSGFPESCSGFLKVVLGEDGASGDPRFKESKLDASRQPAVDHLPCQGIDGQLQGLARSPIRLGLIAHLRGFVIDDHGLIGLAVHPVPSTDHQEIIQRKAEFFFDQGWLFRRRLLVGEKLSEDAATLCQPLLFVFPRQESFRAPRALEDLH